jgi:hypothetical protein
MRFGFHAAVCFALVGLPLSAVGCNAEQSGSTAGSGAGSSNEDTADKPPVSVAEAVAAIDLSKFPTMDGAQNVERSPSYASFTVPGGSVTAAVEFMRTKLGEQGWQPAADAKLTTIAEQGAQLFFVKDGQRLYSALGVSPADKNLNVTLFHLGTTDARKLPHFAGVEFADSLPARTICATTAKPEDVQKALREPFAKAGWREFKEPVPKGMEELYAQQTQRSLKFLQNGTMVDVLIMPVGDKTNIYTTVKLLKAQWPIEPGATYIDFREDPLLLFYPTKLGLKEALEYCKSDLTGRGWKVRDGVGKETAKGTTIVLEAAEREPVKLEVARSQDITFVMLSPWDGKPIATDEKKAD